MNNQIHVHYNYTGKLDIGRARLGSHLDVKNVIFLIICVLIILENFLVLAAIWRNHKFHNRMYFFIGNLAVCDLLAGVAYTVNLLTSGQKTLRLSVLEWFVREGSVLVALSASIFSLLAIAIERYVTMVKMRPYDGNKKYSVFLLIAACWLVAILLGALPILGWNCLGKLTECSNVLPLYTKYYMAFCITIFLLLLLTVVVLYARIYTLVKASGRNVMQHSSSERSMALLRTVSIVVGVFIACWMPLFVLLLADVACRPRHCYLLYEVHWFLSLAMLNSAMNPVIYTLASKEMRRAFLGLLCGRPARGEAQPTPESSRSKSSSSHCHKPADKDAGEAAVTPAYI